MIQRHPHRTAGAVLAVAAVSIFVSGMIGQFNDGPWGELPAWLGAASWFTFLGAAVVLLALSGYLAVANVRHRWAAR